MKRAACLLLLAAVLAACRQERPPLTAAGLTLVEYTEREGWFRCPAPAEWKVKEGSGASRDVMFFGPERVSLSVARYPEGDPAIKTPADYERAARLSGKPGPLVASQLGGRQVFRLSYLDEVRRPHASKPEYLRRTDAILIPVPGGFYALEHRAPQGRHEATLAVLDAAAAGFQSR